MPLTGPGQEDRKRPWALTVDIRRALARQQDGGWEQKPDQRGLQRSEIQSSTHWDGEQRSMTTRGAVSRRWTGQMAQFPPQINCKEK